MELFHTLKTSVDTMREVKRYHLEHQGVTDAAKVLRKEEDTKLFAGFFSKIAKLVANLTYLQKEHVEKVFLHGNTQFIGLVLSHTRMDEHNPTLREWSLMILRNIC